jgi:hypothetical protein
VTDEVTIMAATTTRDTQVVYRVVLDSIGDLASLDIAGLFSGAGLAEAVTDPVYLVCSHGVRDQCCAREGMPVYNALASLRPETVWQTTHLGGHRFAATLVALPQGVQFGRVRADEIGDLVTSLGAGRIYRLDRYRGTTEYSRMVQVAEARIRAIGDHHELTSVRHQSSTDAGEIFEAEGRQIQVCIQSTADARGRAFSCDDGQLRNPPVHQVEISSR